MAPAICRLPDWGLFDGAQSYLESGIAFVVHSQLRLRAISSFGISALANRQARRNWHSATPDAYPVRLGMMVGAVFPDIRFARLGLRSLPRRLWQGSGGLRRAASRTSVHHLRCS